MAGLKSSMDLSEMSLERQIIDRFLATYDVETSRAYRSDLESILRNLDGPLLQSTRSEIGDALKVASVDLSSSSQYRRLSALRSFLSWLYDSDLTERNWSDDVHSVVSYYARGATQNPLSTEAVEVILGCNAARSSRARFRDAALFVVATETGLRRRELSGIDLEHINRSSRPWILSIPESRSGTSSWVVLTERSAEQLLTLTKVYELDRGPIFRSMSNNSRGARLTPESIYRIFKNMVARASIEFEVTSDLLRLTAYARRFSEVKIESSRGFSASFLIGKRRRID